MTLAERFQHIDQRITEREEDTHGRRDGQGRVFRVRDDPPFRQQFAEDNLQSGDEHEAEDDRRWPRRSGLRRRECRAAWKSGSSTRSWRVRRCSRGASEARVTPSWVAERYVSRRASRVWTARAGVAAFRQFSIRVWRTRTSANSAATKKPLSAPAAGSGPVSDRDASNKVTVRFHTNACHCARRGGASGDGRTSHYLHSKSIGIVTISVYPHFTPVEAHRRTICHGFARRRRGPAPRPRAAPCPHNRGRLPVPRGARGAARDWH